MPNSLERELAEARAEIQRLETRVNDCLAELQRAQDLEKQSRETARLATEELQQFVYAASHDLQEPLRTVSAYAQLLRRDYPAEGQSAEFVALVINGANQASALVRDLLTYSRIRTEPNREPLRLDAAVQRALLVLSERVRDSGAQVTCGELPEVFADESQIANVFERLIDNAIRYRSSAPPLISVTAEEGTEVCTVSVRDNGPGIEPRFHEQVFQPFKRLHGKSIQGSGLGLAICRKIVRLHGGEIRVESDGQHGSTFKFTLPL
jgi:hypothetical protein